MITQVRMRVDDSLIVLLVFFFKVRLGYIIQTGGFTLQLVM